jgi:PucR family transcriptional regulator, purine catabolism regulatory protein
MEAKSLITVRDALTLEVFERAQAHVLCCEEELDREVRWVHMGELPDIARFLVGGELLLTGGLGVGTEAPDQRAYVASLAEAGVAGLVIELAGLVFTEAPPALVDEARRRRLPVVGLRYETRFVEISAQVHAELVDTRVAALEAAEEVVSQFRALLLDGADHVAIVEHLARTTGRAAFLEDSARDLRCWADNGDRSGALLADQWPAHSRGAHDPVGAQDSSPAGTASSATCSWQPITLRGETWGRLHLPSGGRTLSALQPQALREAAAAVAITFLGERASNATYAMRAAALLNRLQIGELDGAEVIARARALGVDLRGRELVAVAMPGDIDALRRGSDCLRTAKLEHLAADLGNYTVFLVRLTSRDDDLAVARTLSDSGLRAGVSRMGPPGTLRAALRQSKQALDGARSGHPGKVIRFDQLGAARLLVRLETAELASYVEDEIGPLLRHDAGSSNPLLPTLRAFLRTDGTRANAAEAVHVQRRTLYYRLERISGLLSIDLTDPGARTRLDLAVQGFDLLQQSAGGA